MYRLSSGRWSQLGNTLTGDKEKDRYGYHFDLSYDGNTIVVGGPIHNDRKGHVQVYSYQSGKWKQSGGDFDGEYSEDQIGFKNTMSISRDGSIIAIGRRGMCNTSDGVDCFSKGFIKVYQFGNCPNSSGSCWNQIGNVILGERLGDNFGQTVSLSADGKTVAGGIWANDPNRKNPSSGRVRVLSYSENCNCWKKLARRLTRLVHLMSFIRLFCRVMGSILLLVQVHQARVKSDTPVFIIIVI